MKAGPRSWGQISCLGASLHAIPLARLRPIFPLYIKELIVGVELENVVDFVLFWSRSYDLKVIGKNQRGED